MVFTLIFEKYVVSKTPDPVRHISSSSSLKKKTIIISGVSENGRFSIFIMTYLSTSSSKTTQNNNRTDKSESILVVVILNSAGINTQKVEETTNFVCGQIKLCKKKYPVKLEGSKLTNHSEEGNKKITNVIKVNLENLENATKEVIHQLKATAKHL